MNKPLVSIIVPVYNTSKYLRRCLESICQQTYKEIEIIVVDDGSTDESPSICDEFASQDNRVKVFHRSNHGLAESRRYGISHSIGTYIQHIDSDDWVEPNLVEILTNEAISADADVVGFNFIWEKAEGSTPMDVCSPNAEDYRRKILRSEWATIWRAFAKRDVYCQKEFIVPVGIFGGEDYISVAQLLLFSNNPVCINDYLYHYNACNDSSFMASRNLHKIFDQVRATSIVESILLEHNLGKHYHKELIIRKLCAKGPLASIEWSLWLQVFPEASRYTDNKRMWLRWLWCKLTLQTK